MHLHSVCLWQNQNKVCQARFLFFFLPFFFFNIYLFSCAGSYLQHVGSLLQHAGSLVAACDLLVVACGM